MSRIVPDRHRAIAREAQQLQRTLFRRRHELWAAPPTDPLELIDPSVIATQILGIRYSEPEEIRLAAGRGPVAGVMDRRSREIAVARYQRPEVRRFTAAHEIGHWILHTGAQRFLDAPLDGSNRDPERSIEEQEADLFAAVLLMPEDLVRQQFEEYLEREILGEAHSSRWRSGVVLFCNACNSVPTLEVEHRLLQDDKFLRYLMVCTDENLKWATCRQPVSSFSTRPSPFEDLASLFRVSPGAMASRLEELRLVSRLPAWGQEVPLGPEEFAPAAPLTRTPEPGRTEPKVYEELIDFIARRNPSEVIAFRPSEEAHIRLDELLDREESSGLTAEERSELDHYLQLEHIMRMAKARARQYLSSTSVR